MASNNSNNIASPTPTATSSFWKRMPVYAPARVYMKTTDEKKEIDVCKRTSWIASPPALSPGTSYFDQPLSSASSRHGSRPGTPSIQSRRDDAIRKRAGSNNSSNSGIQPPDVPSISRTASATSRQSMDLNASISRLSISRTNSLADSAAQLPVNLTREEKFTKILSSANVDSDELRKLSWNGIPDRHRSMAWQILLGYLPCNASRREQTLERKRKEYNDWATQTFSKGESALDSELWHQISIDVPRTVPVSKLFRHEKIQKSLSRVLYCWAIRHPASGYVQGINDLVTPFYVVFLSPYIGKYADPNTCKPSQLPQPVIDKVEADSFWCLSKLLDRIQDNYTHAQPGIQRQIVKLKDLVERINGKLTKHLESQGIEFIQFAFRWINCLLVREFSLNNTVRMWDTYLAETDGFSEFHIYVCAAFLLKWANTLTNQDFQELIIFLQSPPTSDWTHKDIELILSEAYMYKYLYDSSPQHFTTTQTQ
ncbi:GTPase-activating protein [Mycoemilia scoparia]|uniref:GTPase-activating protein n=1 Tax=Mycoemilia scoparia TaxID=417184 RepID=A0A9W8DP06_9FUNG|nr:GTPase-activating protein [Mycoemilia scoparia]